MVVGRRSGTRETSRGAGNNSHKKKAGRGHFLRRLDGMRALAASSVASAIVALVWLVWNVGWKQLREAAKPRVKILYYVECIG